jgi:hypothetical protein
VIDQSGTTSGRGEFDQRRGPQGRIGDAEPVAARDAIQRAPRSSTLMTIRAVHSPPRAVLIPRAVNALATPRKLLTPLFCICSIIGLALAENRSATALLASRARWRALARFGLPRRLPRALATCSASLAALRDHFSLVLRHGREDVHRQLVGMRIIERHELDAAVHQRGDERQIAAQPIELWRLRAWPCASCRAQAQRRAEGDSPCLPLSTSVNSASCRR